KKADAMSKTSDSQCCKLAFHSHIYMAAKQTSFSLKTTEPPAGKQKSCGMGFLVLTSFHAAF
ncbi:hypothetical protein NL489_27425, partial [Klebsiella pneumoniae]|nr:hypothetical protein [Klebsiella pneumoniae]